MATMEKYIEMKMQFPNHCRQCRGELLPGTKQWGIKDDNGKWKFLCQACYATSPQEPAGAGSAKKSGKKAQPETSVEVQDFAADLDIFGTGSGPAFVPDLKDVAAAYEKADKSADPFACAKAQEEREKNRLDSFDTIVKQAPFRVCLR